MTSAVRVFHASSHGVSSVIREGGVCVAKAQAHGQLLVGGDQMAHGVADVPVVHDGRAPRPVAVRHLPQQRTQSGDGGGVRDRVRGDARHGGPGPQREGEHTVRPGGTAADGRPRRPRTAARGPGGSRTVLRDRRGTAARGR
jgi:hypothetical protein